MRPNPTTLAGKWGSAVYFAFNNTFLLINVTLNLKNGSNAKNIFLKYFFNFWTSYLQFEQIWLGFRKDRGRFGNKSIEKSHL